MDDTVYKIAIAALLHDIGKFAERASASQIQSSELRAAFYPDEQFLNRNMDLYQPHYNDKYTHKHAVYTAAFIDHLERLLPREFNRGQWGLNDSFVNLAAGHHKPETPLQWIIAMADRVSSGFERDKFEDYNNEINVRDYKKTRLLTLFERIAIDGHQDGENLESYKFRYPLKELSPKDIFPVDREEYRQLDSEQASEEYRELFFNFVVAIEGLEHRQNIPLWLEHFDSLFMIYASHIPAATVGRVIPDVSLYDHSRTTAALATAIYLYHLQNGSLEIEKIKDYRDEKFLIVTGDFYGIQNFIFSEGGGTNKAAAKLLRGRSFAVSLITELAADMLCRETGLTACSVILNAAGKFTILAPNTQQTRDKIKAVEERINDWLIRMFYGESSMGISFIEASCDDFVSGRFSTLWERLGKESERKKYKKIDLGKYGGVVEGYLDQFNNDLSKKLCPFCGRRPSNSDLENDPFLGDEKSACKICRDHIYIGTNLVKVPRIAATTPDAEIYGGKLKEPIFGEYQVSLDVDGRLSQLANTGKLLKYWDISISEEGRIAKDITAKFINGYVPQYNDSDGTDESLNRLLHGEKTEKKKEELFNMIRDGIPKSFHHIAKWALNPADRPDKFKGIEALGILKADVDNLGLIFAVGLKKQNLSRLAALSRQMNHYFSIYIPFVLSTKEKFKDIYTVFAGGDDLFLIGPWNRIIDFALFLNESFTNYVCGNSHITICAGISINKPGEPIPSIYERAEDALKKSKGNGKDSVTLFEESFKWTEFEKLNEIKSTIQDWMDKEYINNAMLFRLNALSNMAEEADELIRAGEGINKEDWECLKWRSRFRYTLVRNVGKSLKGGERDNAIREVEEAVAWLDQYKSAMKIPIWQIIYNKR